MADGGGDLISRLGFRWGRRDEQYHAGTVIPRRRQTTGGLGRGEKHRRGSWRSRRRLSVGAWQGAAPQREVEAVLPSTGGAQQGSRTPAHRLMRVVRPRGRLRLVADAADP